ncbi:MAG TPA: HXXEE domain-containing protein [Candidatus Limnocylindrales bacterium]|nr:HXXEE domain-containing protein [Candidatus Limnocylindrales bacterium]
MISKRFKKIILLLIPVIYLHGVEEIITGFYKNDFYMEYFSSFFTSILQAHYYSSHIVWWLMIGPALLLAFGGKWRLSVLTLFGLFFFMELHHLIDAIKTMNYYPGVITNLIMEILGIFYWKEIILAWKNYDRN